jgi:Tfp pilus assembly protein PilF
MLKGLTNAQLGRRDIAIEQLSDYLAHGGDDSRARLALAVMLTKRSDTKQGDLAKAWQTLKPLADSANATMAPLQLAAALAAANHDPAAAGYAARAVGLSHDDAHDLAAANAAINVGDWRHADAIYTRLLSGTPGTSGNRVLLLNNAAYAKINLGDASGAVALARQAAALAPDDPIVLDTLGWALIKAGGAGEEAKRLLTRAASLQPGNATIRQHLLAAQASAG